MLTTLIGGFCAAVPAHPFEAACAAMAAMGFGGNNLRLPLTPMESANEAKLLGLMKAQGLI